MWREKKLAAVGALEYALGAIVNVGMRAYVDYTDNGQINDSAVQYLTSGGVGAFAGGFITKLGFVWGLVSTGITSAGENVVTDGSIQPQEVASTMAGYGIGRLVGFGLGTKAMQGTLNPSASTVLQYGSELGVSTFSYSLLRGAHDESVLDENDKGNDSE